MMTTGRTSRLLRIDGRAQAGLEFPLLRLISVCLCAAWYGLRAPEPVQAEESGFVWRLLDAKLQNPRHAGAAACVNGTIYTIGGSDCSNGLGQYQNTTERYDAVADLWVPMQHMTLGRHSFGCAVLGDFIYVVGGHNILDRTECEKYDVENNQWTSIGSLTKSRNGAGVVACAGKIYAIGGNLNVLPDDYVEVYDPTTNKWAPDPDAATPERVCPWRAVCLDNKIYLVGPSVCRTECYSPTKEVWCYDPNAPIGSRWRTDLPQLKLVRRLHELVVANGRIYAIGGVARDSYESVVPLVESWAPVEGNWRVESSSLKVARAQFMAAAWGCHIYVVGGHDWTSGGCLDSTEMFTWDIAFVRQDALDIGDGATWASAYKELQSALRDASNPRSGVKRVWAARGTYKPDFDVDSRAHTCNRPASFQMINGVPIYGGFSGDEDPDTFNLMDRSFTANETVLSGDIHSDGNQDSYHVVSAHAVQENATLDGFTIMGGNADGNFQDSYGGGAYIVDSNPTIRNCRFLGNSAKYGGAGMFNLIGSPLITRCDFIGNSVSPAEPFGEGGGVCNMFMSQPRLENCLFRDNSAPKGGGMQNIDSAPTLMSCTFIGNISTRIGGGGTHNETSDPVLIDCVFRGNSGHQGGGICSVGHVTELFNCVFLGNRADLGGAFFSEEYASLELTNCTIAGNVALNSGGGLYATGVTATLGNCILWGNAAPKGAQLACSDGTYLDVAYSNVQGGQPDVFPGPGSSVTWGNNNIDADPLLTGDGHLRSGPSCTSPCVDAGDPGFVADPHASTDIDGDDRIVGAQVDIGADEFRDTDGDRLPDWWETRYFGLPTVADPDGHGDGDGRTNLLEYELYSSNPIAAPYYVSADTGNNAWDGRSLTYQGGMTGPKKTIQAAIDVAEDGDSVLVAHGTYSGVGNKDLDFAGKTIVVRGRLGPRYTIIDCGDDGRAIATDSIKGTFTVLEGFTIQNGAADLGGGIRSDQSSLMLRNCILKDNNATDEGGSFYSHLGTPTVDGLTIQDNVAPEGKAGAGVVDHSNVNLQGDLTLEAGTMAVTSSWFYGPGCISLTSDTVFNVTGTPGDPPAVTRSNIAGPGHIEIDAGQYLIVEGNATVNLSDGQGNRGTVIVNGKLVARDHSTIQNSNVNVRQAAITTETPIQFNDIHLVDSLNSGGEFFVENSATIEHNAITSEGDRYLDLDPDPAATVHPTIDGNTIHVVIDTNPALRRGTLLELRAKDFECEEGGSNPTCASGAMQAPVTGRFAGDLAQNWVLDTLEILPGAKLNLTNRPGLVYQTDTTYPETVYVKTLKLHPGAGLNTALQTLYYESLVDENNAPIDPNQLPDQTGRKIVDEPLLGFSLGIIAMNDTTASPFNEFDIRIRKRLRDSDDAQLCQCDGACVNNDPPKDPTTCKEGSIERLPDARGTGNGVMDIRTQGADRESATSVAAKGSFARAGDERITIAFEYRWIQAGGGDGTLVVYLSDRPEVGNRSFEMARVYIPDPGRPGSVSSEQWATFYGTFPRRFTDNDGNDIELNFTRGTYVELELRGKGTRIWIDNWDPVIDCSLKQCGDLNGIGGVDNYDYLLLLAEYGRALTAGDPKFCLDVLLDGDRYVDLNNLLTWDAVLDPLNPLPNLCGALGSQSAMSSAPSTSQTNALTQDGGAKTGLWIAAKKKTELFPKDYLFHIGSDRACLGAEAVPPVGSKEVLRGSGRLVKDAQGTVYQIHGTLGLRRQDGMVVVSPREKDYEGSRVTVGITPSGFGVPLKDAAFDPDDASVVYVVPVAVRASSGEQNAYKATARLALTKNNGEFTGDFQVTMIYGANPYTYSSVIKTTWGEVLFYPDKQQVREIEVDSRGRLFVLSAQALNDDDWVVIYDKVTGSEIVPGGVGIRQIQADLKGPSAMLVSSREDKLYLASSVNDLPDAKTRLFRFTISESGLTQDGSIDIENPKHDLDPPYTTYGHKATIISVQENPINGNLYVTGFTLPRVDPPGCDSEECGALNANEDLFHGPIFTTPTLAVVPTGASGSVMANEISCDDLGLPVSAIFLSAVACNRPPSDLDGDGDVDGFDFLTFSNCYNGSDRPPLSACENLCADLEYDSDVDGFDFLTFANCYNGSDRPSLCP